MGMSSFLHAKCSGRRASLLMILSGLFGLTIVASLFYHFAGPVYFPGLVIRYPVSRSQVLRIYVDECALGDTYLYKQSYEKIMRDKEGYRELIASWLLEGRHPRVKINLMQLLAQCEGFTDPEIVQIYDALHDDDNFQVRIEVFRLLMGAESRLGGEYLIEMINGELGRIEERGILALSGMLVICNERVEDEAKIGASEVQVILTICRNIISATSLEILSVSAGRILEKIHG